MNIYKLGSTGAISQNSSGGKLLKWQVGNTFIKTSTLDNTSLGKPKFMCESYGEVIGYTIAKLLGLNAVEYRLCKVIIDNQIETIACESRNFLSPGFEYMSIAKLMIQGVIPTLYLGDTNNYNNLVVILKKYNKNIRYYIDSLIILDYIILNDDRHYGNFGFITNREIIKLAPVFDSGNCCFCHKNVDEIEYASDLYTFLRSKPFSIDFEEQIKLVGNRRIKINPGYNGVIQNTLYKLMADGLSSYRAKFIYDLLIDRISRLKSKGIIY